jgi:hypothetical protein
MLIRIMYDTKERFRKEDKEFVVKEIVAFAVVSDGHKDL